MQLLLQDFKPFNSLPPQLLAKLQENLMLKTFPRDTFVFTEGQVSLGQLYLVIEGLGEIIKGSNVVGLRRPGEFFGETVILTGKRYPASVKAVEDLKCYVLTQNDFENVLQSDKEFAGYFVHLLTDRLRDIYADMVSEQPYETFGMSFEPFKQQLVDIMSTPVVTCSPDLTVFQVARIFMENKISSVIVADDKGKMLGLVSERDLITKVVALNCSAGAVYAKDILEKNPPCLPPNALFHQALLTMLKNQGKYIVVVDQNKPVGIVTIGDLTRARTTSSLNVMKQIDTSKSVDELVDAASLISKIVVTMIAEKATAKEITLVVSELNDILTKRLLILGEEYLENRGFSQVPLDYCWLTLGSGGRKELTLSSDQDNAIIYADPVAEDKQKFASYFQALGEFVTEGLAKCGFKKCPGEIMANNPEWCRSTSSWKSLVKIWANSSNLDSSREFTIFLDFRPVHGQEYLAHDLREYVQRLFRVNPAILHTMAIDDLMHRVPLNLFKQVRVEKSKEHKDEVDLKKAACVHLLDCARLFAMREGISETNTLDRLRKLIQIEAIAAEDAEYYEAAVQSLLMFRIRENLRKISLGQEADNYINPASLTKREQSVLRESFLAVDRFQSFTAFSFQVDRV